MKKAPLTNRRRLSAKTGLIPRLPFEFLTSHGEISVLPIFQNIPTPLLTIHSEQDLRGDISQAEQPFVMLKMLKRKVEFIRFSEEPHGMSRHGRPDRRVARLELIVKWFDRYLK